MLQIADDALKQLIKVAQEQKATTEVTKEKVAESSLIKDFGNLLASINPLNSLTNMIIWVVAVIVVGGIIYGLTVGSSRKEDDDQDGGNYNNDDTVNMIVISLVALFFLNTLLSSRRL
jgi:p-aminobenzoyl-glutamate transporter AbgT